MITVNVGGSLFATNMSTLTKYSDSMLFTMFRGSHQIVRDREGNPFIDANPAYFGHILEFLRHETMPPAELAVQMYHQACYYVIAPLIDRLKITPIVSRMLVKEAIRELYPGYNDAKQRIVEVAMKNAVTSGDPKKGTATVHAFREHFKPSKPEYADHVCVASMADVAIGPWSLTTKPEVVLKMLRLDLQEDGYEVAREDSKSVVRCEYFSGDSDDLWNGTIEHCTNIVATIVLHF